MSIATTKMTSKGQVVIPEEIRDQLHLDTGTKFLVMGEKDYVIFKTLKAPSNDEFTELLDRISDEARQTGMTESDIVAAIKESRATKK